VTRDVTSARNARLDPEPQQFVVASPSEAPVNGLPSRKMFSLSYTAPTPELSMPCQYRNAFTTEPETPLMVIVPDPPPAPPTPADVQSMLLRAV
jgi:hypothetical protein